MHDWACAAAVGQIQAMLLCCAVLLQPNLLSSSRRGVSISSGSTLRTASESHGPMWRHIRVVQCTAATAAAVKSKQTRHIGGLPRLRTALIVVCSNAWC
jgi:hypothetical protein